VGSPRTPVVARPTATPPLFKGSLYIGTAGWSIPAACASHFPADGSHLERYAQVFNAVEINSSFYRPHLPATYRKWADAVPADFRFAVKVPRTISHQAKLKACQPLLESFLAQVEQLGEKLGCLLLQLPPSLAYDSDIALPFFDLLRRMVRCPVACEPRHVSWFSGVASRALQARHIARVAADPARNPRAALPAGARSMQYLRLHGSPRMYYDAYSDSVLQRVSRRLLQADPRTDERWCIFDNTALGYATANAMALVELTQPRKLGRGSRASPA
jgi:uncharacterized protein YecE (DUF72 family)